MSDHGFKPPTLSAIISAGPGAVRSLHRSLRIHGKTHMNNRLPRMLVALLIIGGLGATAADTHNVTSADQSAEGPVKAEAGSALSCLSVMMTHPKGYDTINVKNLCPTPVSWSGIVREVKQAGCTCYGSEKCTMVECTNPFNVSWKVDSAPQVCEISLNFSSASYASRCPARKR